MSAQLNFASPSPTLIVATAALATIIALGILLAVVTLFQSRGAPLERLAAAEHACAHTNYFSERQACMNEWLVRDAAGVRSPSIARTRKSLRGASRIVFGRDGCFGSVLREEIGVDIG